MHPRQNYWATGCNYRLMQYKMNKIDYKAVDNKRDEPFFPLSLHCNVTSGWDRPKPEWLVNNKTLETS